MDSTEEKYRVVKQVLQEWVNQQGHNRCWYYPDLFDRLVEITGITSQVNPQLPPREEFEAGCRKYQKEQYGK